MNPAALKVKNLNVWFETSSGNRRVVDNISFSINKGEATGLVGESGCGKTMTALAILGLLPASGASFRSEGIEINGTDISTLSPAQRRNILGREIAMIFQHPGKALDPVFTVVAESFTVYRRHAGGSKQHITQTMLDALESVGFDQVEDIAATYPHQLSGGMRQLAMIAMATVCKPTVIIADEPTTALDSSSRTLILRQLEQLQTKFQTAILLISHDLTVVRQSCRKVMVMYCGRLLERTDCQSLFFHARHPYSAGLLACIPQISTDRPSTISAIPGQVPAPNDLPTGCHFAPRCNRAELQCQQSVPDFDCQDGRDVACFRPLK